MGTPLVTGSWTRSRFSGFETVIFTLRGSPAPAGPGEDHEEPQAAKDRLEGRCRFPDSVHDDASFLRFRRVSELMVFPHNIL